MRLVVGLGNPGPRYEGTRHNLGFMIADRLAETCRASFRAGKGDFLVAETDIEDVPMAIIKPTTYMNNSGVAVQQALGIYGSELSQTLIVFDEFQLPLGTLRMRPRGTDGGHNGMGSIIYQVESDAIPRLRGGIGSGTMPDGDEATVAFVLSPFEEKEYPIVRTMIDHGAQAVRTWLTRGMEAAMNEFNRPTDQPGQQE